MDELTPEEREEKWKQHLARMARYKELNRLSKAELCAMYRRLGHVWSMHPLEKWRKDEVVMAIIEVEEKRTEGEPRGESR